MRKIPTLFVRDFTRQPAYVIDQVTPGCEWVIAGEGEATVKYDGTCVMLDDDGTWWARREVKAGKTEPARFVQVELDETTGKRVGWEPIEQSSFAKAFHLALDIPTGGVLLPGTYELCGPKINGNPSGFPHHTLVYHAIADRLPLAPRDFETLSWWLHDHTYEGIVWHHPDGRMAKLKRRDFSTCVPLR